ncbi:MAG: VWA-like domain-containing protein [Tenericutes bacterium]|nr:VWA-like domain-containing protein [Mycoplasmatota bacterium]
MKYDIEALKRKMLVKYPFFGSVVAGVKYKEERSVGTAGTDGKTIYYNPDFLEKLSTDEQTFVFAHEVCHIAFNHILRSEGKNPQVWNTATDAVINQFLKRDGLKMVDGGVDIADAINYDAEQLYEKMMKEQQQNQSGFGNGQQDQNQEQQQNQGSSENGQQDQSQEQQQNQSGSGNGQQDQNQEQQDVGHDTHSLWEEAVKKHKEEQEKPKEKTEIEKKQEELEEMGEKDAFKKNRDEKKQQLEELKQAIAKQASTPGTSTNRDLRTVSDIGTAKPLIDWRYVLREAITYDVDWSYKNATLEDGVLTANLEEMPTPETEIVLDTSGSINEVLLKNFLRECKNILQQSRVKVGCFDTEFYGFHDIRTEEDIENMRFEGGGGTNFDVAVGAFSRRVENKIIFTDGEASMPDMPLDAIWIVFGGEKINPKGGRVINITGEQLDRLYSYEMDTPSRGRSR